MSTLTMPSSPYHHGFPRELLSWQDSTPDLPHRSRESERILLPPIRQTFPELQLQVQHDISTRPPSSSTTPTGRSFTGAITPPEYVHSPTHQKRRRLSPEISGYERDMEQNSLPRMSINPYEDSHRQPSPTSQRGNRRIWDDPNRASPPPRRPMRSPANLEPYDRLEPRSGLPSLVLLNFDRNEADVRRPRMLTGEEYGRELIRRPSITSNGSRLTEAESPTYRPEGLGYGFHHPSRVQSLSVGSVHPFDRTPFSPGLSPRPYDPHIHDAYMRIREYGMGMNGEGKQRKRRGNLPKETTDKLRAWFVAHLHHPYPSEEEKQDLMRQTGLQLNQISNWFINARRRQLPTMINNARAESDAMIVRGGDGKPLPSTERADYEPDGKPLSDCEGSPFGEVELESMKRRRVTNINRGSI
ncbi:hypothetical protein F4804DRAFT_90861 [Jackrogersella minutella]|nr:hypothetical protein F4804DRAFT_90861 [Jackrogersella minutella]